MISYIHVSKHSIKLFLYPNKMEDWFIDNLCRATLQYSRCEHFADEFGIHTSKIRFQHVVLADDIKEDDRLIFS